MKLFKRWTSAQGKLYGALFDSRFYKNNYKVSRPDALHHYLTTGWKKGYNPSAYFDTTWYLETYRDVKAAKICPLEHYIEYGHKEGRLPSPLFDRAMLSEFSNNRNGLPDIAEYILNWSQYKIVPSKYFDLDYYLSHKELQGSTVEPIKHHLTSKAGFQLNPHPLFDTGYYLSQYPDVKSSGMPAVLHYALFGELEGRNPNSIFDTQFVSAQISALAIAQSKPVFAHYALLERKEKIQPSLNFDPKLYFKNNPDVSKSRMGALEHFLTFGRNEGRRMPSPEMSISDPNEQARDTIPAQDSVVGYRHNIPSIFDLSVVIPTYNRVETLKRSLDRCFRLPDIDKVEFVIVNDGSPDGTRDYLDDLASKHHNVIVKHVKNGGPGIARNIGASMASANILLFMGDDIAPTDDSFFSAHISFHLLMPNPGAAMLGKVIWPGDDLGAPGFSVNAVMRAIQGNGGEQFGYADMAPFTWYDWRFFYTANVSLKKVVVHDWLTEGFSPAFKMVNYEDGELAYRLSQKQEDGVDGFHIYYNPLSCGTHEHQYSIEKFVERQQRAGAMALTFLELHPEISQKLGLDSLLKAIKSKSSTNVVYSDHVMLIFKGVGSWISLMEKEGTLGNSGYHEKLLHAYFRFAYQVGFLLSLRDATLNVELAYKSALDEFFAHTKSIVAREHLGQLKFPM